MFMTNMSWWNHENPSLSLGVHISSRVKGTYFLSNCIYFWSLTVSIMLKRGLVHKSHSIQMYDGLIFWSLYGISQALWWWRYIHMLHVQWFCGRGATLTSAAPLQCKEDKHCFHVTSLSKCRWNAVYKFEIRVSSFQHSVILKWM